MTSSALGPPCTPSCSEPPRRLLRSLPVPPQMWSNEPRPFDSPFPPKSAKESDPGPPSWTLSLSLPSHVVGTPSHVVALATESGIQTLARGKRYQGSREAEAHERAQPQFGITSAQTRLRLILTPPFRSDRNATRAIRLPPRSRITTASRCSGYPARANASPARETPAAFKCDLARSKGSSRRNGVPPTLGVFSIQPEHSNVSGRQSP